LQDVDDVLLVSDQEIVEAMVQLFAQDRLVVEPASGVTAPRCGATGTRRARGETL